MLTGRRTACTADLSEGSCTPSWLAKVSTFEPNGLSEKRNEGKEKKNSQAFLPMPKKILFSSP